MRCFALLAVLACANALVVNTLPARSAVAARAAAPAMLEPTSVDAASQLIAGLAIPVPALTPAKASESPSMSADLRWRKKLWEEGLLTSK